MNRAPIGDFQWTVTGGIGEVVRALKTGFMIFIFSVFKGLSQVGGQCIRKLAAIFLGRSIHECMTFIANLVAFDVH